MRGRGHKSLFSCAKCTVPLNRSRVRGIRFWGYCRNIVTMTTNTQTPAQSSRTCWGGRRTPRRGDRRCGHAVRGGGGSTMVSLHAAGANTLRRRNPRSRARRPHALALHRAHGQGEAFSYFWFCLSVCLSVCPSSEAKTHSGISEAVFTCDCCCLYARTSKFYT